MTRETAVLALQQLAGGGAGGDTARPSGTVSSCAATWKTLSAEV